MKPLCQDRSQDMELLPEADGVVRQFMPCLTDAAGLEGAGELLRALAPIDSGRALAAAARELARVRAKDAARVCGPWREPIEAALFWAEAALWAALRGDYRSFTLHVDSMRAVMADVRGPEVH